MAPEITKDLSIDRSDERSDFYAEGEQGTQAGMAIFL